MTIRELHGIAPASGTGRYVQTIQVIDDDGSVIVAMTEMSPATITPEEARYLAGLLHEAADRVDPPEFTTDEAEDVQDPHLAEECVEPEFVVTGRGEWPEAEIVVEPLPSLIAVRNPKRPSAWTPERNAMLKLEVPLGRLTRKQLFEALNELPGPVPIANIGRLGTQAYTLGLKWPEPPTPAPEPQEAAQEPATEPVVTAEDVAPSVAAVPTDLKPTPSPKAPYVLDRLPTFSRVPIPEVIPMNFDQVKELAARWGMAFNSWDDLPPVNAKAERLGHARIERLYATPRKLHNLDAD